jgi:asparagine N-glycosylation enzyme membrane subunit Stt3
LIALETAPVSTKSAIPIYRATSLLSLYFVADEILTDRAISGSVFSRGAPVDTVQTVLVVIVAIGAAFAALKVFLSFKLLARKNRARIAVLVITTLLAAAFLYQAYIFFTYGIPFFPVLKNTCWLVAGLAVAVLLLLPQRRGWFATKRTGASRQGHLVGKKSA